jgi:copper chaperone CopZ
MVKTTVEVTGMACGMCEAHVNDAIRDAFAIKKVSSSHTKNETEIISEEELDAEKIKSVITEQGYEVGAIKSEPYQKKGLFGFGK